MAGSDSAAHTARAIQVMRFRLGRLITLSSDL
jgi:hypothetical protein